MLVPDELKKYGFQRKLKRIEQIWLDYLQDHLLALLYRKYPDLVFRGGTCIWKLYGGERFSEDLDLAHEKISNDLADYLIKEMRLLGFTVSQDKQRETENMYHLRLEIDRPDTGSVTPVSLEILKSLPPEEKIRQQELHSPYPDLSRIDVRALSKDKLLVEKISAVCDRDRPRDMHDIYRLLKNGATTDLEEVQENYVEFTLEKFEECLNEKEQGWKGLKSLMIGDLRQFEEEKQYIINKLQTVLSPGEG